MTAHNSTPPSDSGKPDHRPGDIGPSGIVFPEGDQWSWCSAYFKFVAGYPDYCAGIDGSIWSRRVVGPGTKTGPWRRLRGEVFGGGYLRASLVDESGCRRKIFIHQIILTTFVGPAPDGMESCHFPDRDRANNSLGNLRWDTKKSNSNDKVIHGTMAKGIANGFAKLTDEKVREARRRRAAGETVRAIAKDFGFSERGMYSVISGELWRHVQ